jgi:hypothetical protein
MRGRFLVFCLAERSELPLAEGHAVEASLLRLRLLLPWAFFTLTGRYGQFLQAKMRSLEKQGTPIVEGFKFLLVHC